LCAAGPSLTRLNQTQRQVIQGDAFDIAVKRHLDATMFAADDMPSRELPVPLYDDLWSDSLQARGVYASGTKSAHPLRQAALKVRDNGCPT
jgi:hypothetical protein